MPLIAYDATREALYHPERRDTLLTPGLRLPPDPLAAELSRLAYLRFESDPAQRGRLEQALAWAGLSDRAGFHVPDTATQGFAAREADGSRLWLVFRGTQPDEATDLGTDLHALTVRWDDTSARVHAGFARAFDSVAPQVEAWLHAHGRAPGVAPAAAAVSNGMTRPVLVVTGHSLGAALATLAAQRWHAERLVTFGSPRVGDSAFAELIDPGRVARYVDCCDAVTRVPPSALNFRHVGPMRYIDRHGQVHVDPEKAQMDADRDAARADYMTHLAWRSGNVMVRDLADHAPINYVRALWG